MTFKVLVTGGAGFIGSYIVDQLIEDGHEVTILDNDRVKVDFQEPVDAITPGQALAFYDPETERVEISRFMNGQPAPIHMIDGLPENWIAERDANFRATAIKHSVIAGFVRGDVFYTRSQAAEAVLAEAK